MNNFFKLIKKIQASYSQEKQISDKIVSLWLYHVLRPLSFFLTPIFLKLHISANFATFIGVIIGVFSIIASASGYLLTGSLLYNLFHIIDCVDGNIARIKESSKKGEYYDAISGDFVNYLFLLVSLLDVQQSNYY